MITSPDVRAALRASRQLGLVTRSEALHAGLSTEQIKRRLATRRWKLAAPNVYVITGAPPSWQQSALAACLSRSSSAVVSHMTAAALWGLGSAPLLPHVTVPPAAGARLRVARLHRAAVHERDRTTIGPVPVSRIPRTLIDCAPLVASEELRRLVDTAFDLGRASPADVRAALERRGRAVLGRVALVDAMKAWVAPIAPESPAEARLLRLLDEWAMPPSVRQHVVCDESGTAVGRLDVAWPDRRVGIEYDGSFWHGPRQVERDEARHVRIAAAGWSLVHAYRSDLRAGDVRLRIALAEAGLGLLAA